MRIISKMFKKQLLASVILLSMAFGMILQPLTALADNQHVNDAKKGIVLVDVVYIKDGKEYFIQGGSGFLISGDGKAETVITNDHVVRLKDDTIDLAKEDFGEDISTKVVYRVRVKRDVSVKASIVNSSEATDFAILKLEQPISEKTALKLDSTENISTTQTVYALGFPYIGTYMEDAPVFTEEDVTVTSGIISKQTVVDGIKYLQHESTLNPGSSGGPLINEMGAVVGVNTFRVEGDYYSVQISEVTAILDMLGIAYESANSAGAVVEDPIVGESTVEEPTTEKPVVEEPAESEAVEVNKAELNAAIADAKNLDPSTYEPESRGLLATTISEAEAIAANAEATQAEVERAIQNLSDTKLALIEKQGLPIWIFITAGVALLVVIIVVIIILSTSKKGKKGNAQVSQMVQPQNYQPQPQGQPIQQPQQKPFVQQPGPAYGQAPMPQMGEGELTSVLTQNGETTLLSSTAVAYLVKKSTGTQITINRDYFTIGKKRGTVDYCITGNTSVSRIHASIENKGGVYFISDQNTTNGTYVNGNKVHPGQSVQLATGDIVKLADEEFTFQQ